MAKYEKRYLLPHDIAFMEMVEKWRANQTPIPSKAEAIRTLTLRSIALDSYFEPLISQTIIPIAEAGLLSDNTDTETIPRLKVFWNAMLEFALSLDSSEEIRLEELFDDFRDQLSTPEKPASSKL